MLKADNISFHVGKAVLLNNTTLEFAPGKFHVIMGPNGAGKSTLLKILSGEQVPATGGVDWNGRDMYKISKKELARLRAVLSQQYAIHFPMPVTDIVMMGRYPYFTARPSAEDLAAVHESMAVMDVAQLSGRDYGTLSGGEAQKVQMSRVLAQIGREQIQNKILFLDEPVSHLDVRYQHQLLGAARKLCAKGTTVIAILHDLNLAMAYADRLICMKKARVVFDENNLDLLTNAVIQAVFDVEAEVVIISGRRYVVFKDTAVG